MSKYVTQDEVVERLQQVCDEAGGMAALANKISVSNESVRIILNGNRPPTGKVLKAAGYKKVVLYVKED